MVARIVEIDLMNGSTEEISLSISALFDRYYDTIPH